MPRSELSFLLISSHIAGNSLAESPPDSFDILLNKTPDHNVSSACAFLVLLTGVSNPPHLNVVRSILVSPSPSSPHFCRFWLTRHWLLRARLGGPRRGLARRDVRSVLGTAAVAVLPLIELLRTAGVNSRHGQPVLLQILLALLTKMLLKNHGIAGVGAEHGVSHIAQERDEPNDKVNDDIEHHLRL